MNDQEKMDFFQIKQKFLRDIPHPKLILKAIQQASVKAGVSPPLNLNSNDAVNDQELQEYLNRYIENLLRLKQVISATVNYLDFRDKLIALYTLQMDFFNKMQTYVPLAESYPDETIKMSEPVDGYAVLKRIHQLNLKENEIKNYLYTRLILKAETIDELTEIFLRVNKIVHHA